MPGGKPTVSQTPTDLSSYLARKRIPIELWLLQKNLVSIEAFNAFMKHETSWIYSPEFVNEVTNILIVVEKETAAVKPVVVVPVVETPPAIIEEPVVPNPIETVSEIVPIVEDTTVTSPEEGLEEIPEPSFVISAPKERKKTK